MSRNNVLGLDVGEKRVGIALMRAEVKIAVPLETLDFEDNGFWDKLLAIIETHDVGKIVVGLPRNLEGEDTKQTAYVREFVIELRKQTSLPIVMQDEALTSVNAEKMLNTAGKKYTKSDVDAQAACIILTDYIDSHGASS